MAGEGELTVRRRLPRVLAIIALLLGALLVGLWLARKPLARGQADRFLARTGLPARYTISDLGLGRQRLTDVVIGDPARPDLVADWLETRTAWGLRGPYLAGVRGGRVRVRARWVDGKLSLGGIDRLLLKGEAGKPFALPALALDVADLRARVATPWGLVGAKLSGQGRLDGGFDGRLAVAAARLGAACGAERPEGAWRVRTRGAGLTGPARVVLEGSAQAAGLACAGATVGYANANGTATLTLGERLGWSLAQDIAATDLRHKAGSARSLAARVALARARDVRGSVSLRATDFMASGVRAAQLMLDGTVFQDAARRGALAYRGRAGWTGGQVRVGPVRAFASAGQDTPVGPLLRGLAASVADASADTRGEASLYAAADPAGAVVNLFAASLTSGSGAALAYGGAPGLSWSAGQGWRVGGTARLSGGGMPTAGVRFDGRPNLISGVARLAPYVAGDARLALTPVAFSNAGGGWRVRTRAALSGPLPGGRIDGLTLPVDARWRDGTLTLAGGCAPLSWVRLALSGLRLDPATLRICSTGAALVTVRGDRLDGGARIAAARLTGRLGSTPLALGTAGAQVRLADRDISLTGVEARLGSPERATRLSVGSLSGRLGAEGLGGRFSQAGGQIGAVPLVMSEAAGQWRFGNGVLTLDGGLTVSDAAAPARFQPMAARGVTLWLADNRIAAGGMLHEPTTGTKVADVAIRHDLGGGSGTADLTVAGLTFAKGFQPNLLTRLTYGVIADVRGAVNGEGRIAWSPDGVTSTGAFRTASTDLAAAFGPVTGLAGEIRFTDLLQLQSAPGQRLTVKAINPGVPVTDGVVLFQTLPGTRVQVEGARWPFAGGELTLDPTLLDFSAAAERRMTFRVTGAAADKFLQSFDFKNLNATGTFDGVLPMAFDASGGRIQDGRLTVRPGGGTTAYVGDISRKNLGLWGDFAFGALRSLRYRSLGVVMNGPLAGEMVTEVRFAGVSQGEGAKSNFIIRRLQRLPFIFNIRIRAPFRGLLDATASFYDPKRLIERNLPELIRKQNQAIQPPASETVP